MLTRIKDDLNLFLKQYDLEFSSRIFEDSIYLLANLEISEAQMRCFHLAKKLNETACSFSTPKFDEKNKSKLLQFCGMPIREKLAGNSDDYDDYSMEDVYEISESHLESTVIPAFKNFISTLHLTHPDFLIHHQYKSKNIFERQALKQMKEHATPLFEVLDKESELAAPEFSLKSLLLNLIETMKSLKGYHAYFDYESLDKVLNDFIHIQLELEKARLQCNEKYTNIIGLIFDNLNIYLQVNPIKEYLKWLSIRKELNGFLYDLKISIHECDIFEDTLLQLAGISNYGSHCKFDMDYKNKSCMSIYIPDLSQADTETFLNFLHQSGAASAKVISSCYEVGEQSDMMIDEDGRCFFTIPTPGVSYNIDSLEVKNHILPLFKDKINAIKTNDLSSLTLYQELSVRRFKDKMAANAIVESTNKPAAEIEKPASTTSQIFQALNSSPATAMNTSDSDNKISKPEADTELGRGGPPKIPPVLGNKVRVYYENPQVRRDKYGVYSGMNMEESKKVTDDKEKERSPNEASTENDDSYQSNAFGLK